ncbi:hypothetical protein PS631_01728 [Pseudomonas fluorescens]|uniref:LysB family phage lysis regulatory protein n=1 Tax=Pseudomonas fluorescens TaxID=294 RepID=A0A5E6RMU3_PSEFL|nr:hypothetical protein PS631_01728 [Pseudomonas fluorescens]
MIGLREGLLAGALLAAVSAGLWGWGQQVLLGAEKGKSKALQDQLTTAQGEARDNLAAANTLKTTLERERESQAKLLLIQGELRAGLANRESQIEDLKNENEELRNWADQPIPGAARRLRQRPAITGAAAYRQWLSRGGPLPAAGDEASPERPSTD